MKVIKVTLFSFGSLQDFHISNTVAKGGWVQSCYEKSADPKENHTVRRLLRSLFADARQNKWWCCALGKSQELAFSALLFLFVKACGERTRCNGFKLKGGQLYFSHKQSIFLQWRWLTRLFRLWRKIWMLHSWKYSRKGWVGLWPAWKSERISQQGIQEEKD